MVASLIESLKPTLGNKISVVAGPRGLGFRIQYFNEMKLFLNWGPLIVLHKKDLAL